MDCKIIMINVCVLLFIPFVTPAVLLLTLFVLFTEPRVGKAQAKRMEGNSRSHRNYRDCRPLLADAAAIG